MLKGKLPEFVVPNLKGFTVTTLHSMLLIGKSQSLKGYATAAAEAICVQRTYPKAIGP